jgi:hypothetical protein
VGGSLVDMVKCEVAANSFSQFDTRPQHGQERASPINSINNIKTFGIRENTYLYIMNGIGTKIEPIEISDDEAPRSHKRKRDASEMTQHEPEQYERNVRSMVCSCLCKTSCAYTSVVESPVINVAQSKRLFQYQ